MKIKNCGAVIALVVFAASCSKESNENDVQNDILVPVAVHVEGFSVSTEDFPVTRTDPQTPASYSDVNSITLAFYTANGTEQYKYTQLKDDNTTYTTFGNFSCSLPMGSYTMVVVACHISESSPFELTSLTSASYTGAHAFETFLAKETVSINSTSAVDISTTLQRIVSKLQIVSTDGKASDVTNIRMIFSGGSKSFNPTTGLATSNTGFTNTVGSSVAISSPTSSIGYLYLATDEQTMDVTIQTLDQTENVLFSKTVTNVPFKRNRVTILTGAMYTNSGVAGAFLVSTDWLDPLNADF